MKVVAKKNWTGFLIISCRNHILLLHHSHWSSENIKWILFCYKFWKKPCSHFLIKFIKEVPKSVILVRYQIMFRTMLHDFLQQYLDVYAYDWKLWVDLKLQCWDSEGWMGQRNKRDTCRTYYQKLPMKNIAG